MMATQKEVKQFLKKTRAMDFYNENPNCEVVSYGENTHLVLADGDTIYVFLNNGRYTWVESTMEVWNKYEAMVARRIWRSL